MCCLRGAFHSEPPHIASDLLKHVLSTITSPTFFEIVVVYRDYNFCGVETMEYPTQPPVCTTSRADRAMGIRQHLPEFDVFREIHKVRNFRLVLCADVRVCAGEYPVRVLEEGVATEREKGEFEDSFPETLVIHSPRAFRAGLWQEFCPLLS